MFLQHNNLCMLAFCQVTDWVEPSFSDFSKITNSSSSIPCKKSTTDTNNLWKAKEPFPRLGRGKSEKKKGKSSVDEQQQFCRRDFSQTEPWVDKYKPKAQVESNLYFVFLLMKLHCGL